MKRMHGLMSSVVLVAVASVGAHPDYSKPEIKVEMRQEGDKKVKYMFIDGVKVHEADPEKQPQPPVVTPGATVGQAPSDAVVLFDGSAASMANWTDTKGGPTKWKVVDGALESVKRAGYLQSKQQFGSCQLHVEFATPTSGLEKSGQGRGNSGVFLMGQYEVQVLDSYENVTYPDGQAGALYGRAKPLVNASRKPGEWQSYDIIFHRPLFGEDGELKRRATFTVLHNGVLIQDNVELSGGTGWAGPHAASEYRKHDDVGPIRFQDHGNPVRYRNVWVRPLAD